MADGEWAKVASVADVAEGQVHAVRVGQREIALYHLPGGEFRATDNIVPTNTLSSPTAGWRMAA